jgi:TonB family protein
MRIRESAISSGRLLFNIIVLFSLLASVPSTRSGTFQSKTAVKTTSGKKNSTVEVTTYDPIPEATETCTAEACEWWNQLRKASNDLLKKGDEKSKTRFALLLYGGQQKAYSVPLKDRPAQVLVRGRIAHPELLYTKKINGSVVLSVEYRADGVVGDVKLIKGVGSGVDENVIEAARQTLFLPAIRGGAFVTEWQNAELKLSTGRN